MHKGEGNKNAVGNKGGGRKSAYTEEKMAKMLQDAFFEGIDKVELSAKLKKDKIKLFELALQKAIENPNILMEMFRKLYPDKVMSKTEVTYPQIKIVKPPKKKK